MLEDVCWWGGKSKGVQSRASPDISLEDYHREIPKLRFSATNNEVEYEALLQGMAMVQKMGGKAIEMFLDSRLVVGQVKGELEAKDARMQEYLS